MLFLRCRVKNCESLTSYLLLPPAHLVFRKVMFPVMSVCQSVQWGVPMWPLGMRSSPPTTFLPHHIDLFKLAQLGARPPPHGNPRLPSLPHAPIETCLLGALLPLKHGPLYAHTSIGLQLKSFLVACCCCLHVAFQTRFRLLYSNQYLAQI